MVPLAQSIDAVDLAGDDDLQAILQGKAQGFPGTARTAEGFFQPFHMEIGNGTESAEASYRPGQGLDEPFLYLGEIGVGHEDIVLDLRRQFIRRLAADGRDVCVGNVMPLFLFPQQPFPDDAQAPWTSMPRSGAAN